MPLASVSCDAAHCLIAIWLFATGGAVGSFLNVVVYRLPAGMSLVKPDSHCPACKIPIRWHDNVPVLGWLMLRGRCRDCGARISARYPLVEALTATLFLLLGWVEVLGSGANLPVWPGEAVMLSFSQLLGVCGYHLLLLGTLLAAVLIEYDGRRSPVRLFVPALLVGAAAPMIWPHLHPVAVWATVPREVARLVGSPAGLAAGALLGWLAYRLCGPRWKTGLIFTSACVGTFLGWQAVVVLSIVTTVMHLATAVFRSRLPGARRVPPTTWLALAALVWIVGWARLVAWWPILR